MIKHFLSAVLGTRTNREGHLCSFMSRSMNLQWIKNWLKWFHTEIADRNSKSWLILWVVLTFWLCNGNFHWKCYLSQLCKWCFFLTFLEVEKLKGMLSEQDGGNNTVSQAKSLSHDLKTARQEAAQAQENLKVNWINLLMCFNFQNLGLLKAVSVHSCVQKNTRLNEEGGRMRSCRWLVRLKRQRTRGTRKWGNSLRIENASISSKDSWYESKLVWIWKHVTTYWLSTNQSLSLYCVLITCISQVS